MLVSLLLWHCACTRHLKRLAVQWPVCAVDQKQDLLVGENKKTIGKADFFFHGALSVSSVGLSSRLSSKCRLKKC